MLPSDAILQERYQIIRLIGQGGMGAVYEALDLRLGTLVALKQTLVPGDQMSKAFEREARLLASLRHSGLPKVIDHFGDTTGQYLVMEYIAGDDLGTLLDRRGAPFSLNEAMHWAAQLLRVLEYLHRQQPPVLHRDIKPQNLKITADGELVLLDFGLAKSASMLSRLSNNGSVLGYTPHYAPLEQIHNAGTDPRSDLYSLAATLHHLLTGFRPVDALSRASAILRGLPDPQISAVELNPRVPAGISAVLMQSLALNPDERPATAVAMRAALDQARFSTPAAPSDWSAARVTTPLIATRTPTQEAQPATPDVPAAPIVHVVSPVTFEVADPPRVVIITTHEPTVKPAAASPSAPQRKVRGPIAEPQITPSDPTLAAPDLHSPSRVASAHTPAQNSRVPRITTLLHDRRLLALPVLLVIIILFIATQQRPAVPTPSVSVETPIIRRSPVPTAAVAVVVRTTPTQIPTPQAVPTATIVPTSVAVNRLMPVAGAIEPTNAYTATLPLILTVRGANLDQAGTFTLVRADGLVITPAMTLSAPGSVSLTLADLPQPLNGEASFTLHIDEIAQPNVAIMLRDFTEQRIVAGVRAEYDWSGRVVSDAAGVYTTLMAQPEVRGEPVGVLRNEQRVDILRDDVDGWYLLRVSGNGEVVLAGAVGWVERWLVDNQGVPEQRLTFVASLGQTPTDAAVQCGSQFNSSIYGSVSDRNGRGVVGAVVQVTSADGRNRFSARTGRGGTYTVGGLGCTSWAVRLVQLPLGEELSASAVTVRNLNGGQYTAAEVRFRQR